MNQQCKVCGEPAAGFHFGAFTCEGCKSFFGRSYNNLSSISECKNNGECVINKKNRTSCKACRLRKCLLVGMSKSGSRYGRRSNWFKIHCLLQEQQQQQQQQQQQHSHHHQPQQHLHHQQMRQKSPPLGLLGHQHALDQRLHHQLAAAALSHHRTKEDLMLLGLDEYKTAASPSVSSPESHNSDSSVEIGDQRLASPAKDLFVPLPFASLAGVGVFPHAFLPAAAPFLFPTHGGYLYPPKHHLLKAPPPLNNNNNNVEPNSKRFYLDAILKSQQLSEDESSRLTAEDDGRSSSSPLAPPTAEQDNPMDLSMKGCRIRHGGCSPCTPPRDSPHSDPDDVDSEREDDDDVDDDDSLSQRRQMSALAEHRATPMDLTTRA